MLRKIEENIHSFSDQQLEDLFRMQLHYLENIQQDDISLKRFIEMSQTMAVYPRWDHLKYPAVMAITKVHYTNTRDFRFILLVEEGGLYFPGVVMNCGKEALIESTELASLSGSIQRESFIDKLRIFYRHKKRASEQFEKDFDEMINQIEWLRNKIK